MRVTGRGSRLPVLGSRRLFLVFEAMLFGSLFSGYAMLRAGSNSWPGPVGAFPWLETVLLLGASAAFGAKRSQLVVSNTVSLTFVVIKVLGDATLIGNGITPATHVMWACWFTLTGVHAAHVLGGALFTGWLAGPAFRMSGPGSREPGTDREQWLERIEATRRYWLFLDLIWLLIVVSFYF